MELLWLKCPLPSDKVSEKDIKWKQEDAQQLIVGYWKQIR